MREGDENLEARARARIGSVLGGKYQLERLLGIGGTAAVYAASHRNKAQLAVKVLHAELSLREDIRRRFLREGYVANSVGHPGVVLVVDDDVSEDGAAFVVMELLRGESVDALCRRHGSRLPLGAVAAIGSQVLDVLAAAHAKGIVHRDIKPANLFVTQEGAVKVLDFGIARLRDAAAGNSIATQTGMALGTPAFMAPEQALAEARDIDARTDVWAVGATLFALASGHHVHEGDNAQQLMVRAATRPARPLSTVTTDVPSQVAIVIDRALAFERADRWPTASGMRNALLEGYASATGRPLDGTTLRKLLFEGIPAHPSPPATRRLESASHTSLAGTVERPVANSLAAPLPTTKATGSSRRRGATWMLVSALVAILASVGVLAWRLAPTPGAPAPASPSASAGAAPSVTAIVDLPAPSTTVPEALAEYRQGLQLAEDDSWEQADRHFVRAAQLDPSMVEGYLRGALYGQGSRIGRDEFAKAMALRAQLSERDRVMLDAVEPTIGRSAQDRQESIRRLKAASERYPGDVEFLVILGIVYMPGPGIQGPPQPAQTLAIGRRITAIDSLNATGWELIADAARALGDFETERSAAQRCAKTSAESSDCMGHLVYIEAVSGHCDRMEALATRQADVAPLWGGSMLLSAMRAMARPEGARRAVFDRQLANEPPERRAYDEGIYETDLALDHGRFDAALALLDGLTRTVDANDALKTDPGFGKRLLATRLQALLETGDLARARRVAAEILDGFESIQGDPSLGYTALAGRPLEPIRSSWVKDELDRGEDGTSVWLSGWAIPTLTSEDARAALGSIEHEPRLKLPALASDAAWWFGSDTVTGHVLVLAGRAEDALVYLLRQTTSCWDRASNFEFVQSHLDLGRALEQTGDVMGACAAYGMVLARWGHATPRSLSAEAARAGTRRLHCAK